MHLYKNVCKLSLQVFRNVSLITDAKKLYQTLTFHVKHSEQERCCHVAHRKNNLLLTRKVLSFHLL